MCAYLKKKGGDSVKSKYNVGDIINGFELVERINWTDWKCICPKCGSECIKTIGNMRKQKGCKNCKLSDITTKHPDMVGQRFGRLTVLEYLKNSEWKCLCDCGNETIVKTAHLRDGHTQSCGCYMRDRISEANSKDLVGMKFGKLTVLSRAEDYCFKGGAKARQYLCACECGIKTTVLGSNLTSGNTKSCGCLAFSEGEWYVDNILYNDKVNYRRQFIIDGLVSEKGSSLKFDFALLSDDEKLLCLIEFQGEQHYYTEERKTVFGLKERQETDKLKLEYCKAHGIPLEYIRYDEDIFARTKEIEKKYCMPIPCQD